MKVILSRKGFDSEFGGSPSPLIENQPIISLPIPSSIGDNYKEINYNNNRSFFKIMQDLGIEPNFGNGYCHLDPDLNHHTKDRHPEWRGTFGQALAAQGHLNNQDVGPGDLFLFFGWYRRAHYFDEKLLYQSTEDLHVIFGYLLVDKVLRIGPKTEVPTWLNDHPHTSNELRNTANNTIYIAKKELEPGIPGFGNFKFKQDLILTMPGQTRSRWKLNKEIFEGVNISYHSKNSWKTNYFQSASKGQEFVIERNEKVKEWALDLIRENAQTIVKKVA